MPDRPLPTLKYSQGPHLWYVLIDQSDPIANHSSLQASISSHTIHKLKTTQTPLALTKRLNQRDVSAIDEQIPLYVSAEKTEKIKVWRSSIALRSTNQILALIGDI